MFMRQGSEETLFVVNSVSLEDTGKVEPCTFLMVVG